MKLLMCVYVRTKFRVSSIILTSFRREVILPTPALPRPAKWTPKNSSQIKVNLKTIPNRYIPCFKDNLFVSKSVSWWPTSRINTLTVSYNLGQGFITNWGKCYYKLEQLSYYKMGQTLLQIRATVITYWGSYYKLGQTWLQIRAAITNWGITSNNSWGKFFPLNILIFILKVTPVRSSKAVFSLFSCESDNLTCTLLYSPFIYSYKTFAVPL